MTEELTTISLGDVETGMKLKGVVKQIQLAGAVIDVGLEECDAVLHISQIRKRRVNNVRDFLEEGQGVTVWTRKVDKTNARLDVTMIKPPDVTWESLSAGQLYTGKVTRIEKFGVFVDIGAERPGLVHISELAHGFVSSPSEVVEKGAEVEVKVVGVNREKRQIDLSVKAALPAPEIEKVESGERSDNQERGPELTAMAAALQRAMEGSQEDDAEEKQARADKVNEQSDIMRRTLERHQEES